MNKTHPTAYRTYILVQARLRLGWTQENLAREMGVSRKTILRWENGTTAPLPLLRSKLGELLQIDPANIWPQETEASIQAESASAQSPVAEQTQTFIDPALPLLPAHFLVGRDEELTHLRQRLCQGGSATLTALNGLPGVGKTALAVTLAHDPVVRAHFKDGILWAGLGLEPNIQSHLSRWGALLGMPASEMSSLNDAASWAIALHRTIGTRSMLLIIDDVWVLEHALALKVGGPTCSHLVTTRFPSIAAQIATSGPTAIKELNSEESLGLLHLLAPQVVAQETWRARELIEAVGGLPLALTLLGNYLRQLAYSSPSQRIPAALQRLRDASERLNVSAVQAPVERHPSLPGGTPISLQTVIAVTDQQLDPQASQTLYALSVFPARPNTFSEEAALAVTASTTAVLDQLTDTGLLEISGADRYSLHQTIADYARLRLDDQSVYQRLCTYLTTFVEMHRKDYETLETESNTILVALDIAHEQQRSGELIRMACAFSAFLLSRGLYQTTEMHLQRAYQAARAAADDDSLASILLHLGETAWKTGNYEQSAHYLREGLISARAMDNHERICALLANLGSVIWKSGDYRQAEAYLQEGLRLARELGDRARICMVLDILGSIEIRRGNYGQARAYLEEGLLFARQVQEQEQTCTILLNLGVMSSEQGKYQEAMGYLQESLLIARQLRHQEWISGSLNNLGDAASEQGDYELATRYFQEGLDIARQIGHQEWISFHLLNLGSTARKQRNFGVAEQYLQESLAMADRMGIPQIMCHVLSELGDLHLDQQLTAQAEQDFRRMVATAPDGGQDLLACAQYGLARTLDAQGRSAEAMHLGAVSAAVLETIGHRKGREVRAWHTALLARTQTDA
ncbi:MAG TPA: tetratricopeptide repeat protein [Ktedonobacteraceae bacterium]|nr:tetratricopeptide repeat protein [Ktedonobacteraceae bacterium]